MVDARVYLAVTRCTLELAVVEVGVKSVAAHFRISAGRSTAVATAGDGDFGGGGAARAAAFVGATSRSDQPSRAVVEAAGPDADGMRHIRVGVQVDLASPQAPEDLATAGVLSFAKIDRVLWSTTTFGWEQCRAGVLELQLTGAFAKAASGGNGGDEGGSGIERAAVLTLRARLCAQHAYYPEVQWYLNAIRTSEVHRRCIGTRLIARVNHRPGRLCVLYSHTTFLSTPIIPVRKSFPGALGR